MGWRFLYGFSALAAPCGFVPADNKITLQGSRKTDSRTGMLPIVPAHPCLPRTKGFQNVGQGRERYEAKRKKYGSRVESR